VESSAYTRFASVMPMTLVEQLAAVANHPANATQARGLICARVYASFRSSSCLYSLNGLAASDEGAHMISTIIQFPGVAAAAGSTTTDIPIFEAVPFTATCPKCKDARYQRGYTPRSLFRLLGRNHPIEAYCVVCDAFWAISAGERRALAQRLVTARN